MFLFPLFYVIGEFHRFLHRGKAVSTTWHFSLELVCLCPRDHHDAIKLQFRWHTHINKDISHNSIHLPILTHSSFSSLHVVLCHSAPFCGRKYCCLCSCLSINVYIFSVCYPIMQPSSEGEGTSLLPHHSRFSKSETIRHYLNFFRERLTPSTKA